MSSFIGACLSFLSAASPIYVFPVFVLWPAVRDALASLLLKSVPVARFFLTASRSESPTADETLARRRAPPLQVDPADRSASKSRGSAGGRRRGGGEEPPAVPFP
ncbi:hypothetical protein HPB48_006608 [Haemaphysalis longicornis]|uniref:Uncharacterized protein n=1 Tax=Haemaphysalis longicornis TaxID=44386 RepID=A0A9J6GMC7_HAELO|nr:hypothetical protein HPB48_006608 [Haemaphysalis longicornis]